MTWGPLVSETVAGGQSSGGSASFSPAPAMNGGPCRCASKREKVAYINANPTVSFLRAAMAARAAAVLGVTMQVDLEAGSR
jgi:hypothetical protein